MPAGASAEDRAHAAQAEQERLREWFVCWLGEEEERMGTQRLPIKKSVDEEAYELDPERAVSFEDIQSVLVRFVMPKSRADLVKLFLRYVRVPIHAQTASQVLTSLQVEISCCCSEAVRVHLASPCSSQQFWT